MSFCKQSSEIESLYCARFENSGKNSMWQSYTDMVQGIRSRQEWSFTVAQIVHI